MSVEIECKYSGALTVQNTHLPSGSIIQTTAPKDNGGTGELFSPTDLMGASIGACMLTIMGIVADRHGIQMEGVTVNVTKEMNANPRRIKRLTCLFTLPFSYTDKEKKLLEAAADGCPVKKSLHPEVEIDCRFNYGG